MLVFMFEKIGLAAPKRGGKQHKGHYSRQLDAWERDPAELWRRLEAGRSPQSFKVDNSPAARAKRAVEAAKNGLAARAVAALDSGALAAQDLRLQQSLRASIRRKANQLNNVISTTFRLLGRISFRKRWLRRRYAPSRKAQPRGVCVRSIWWMLSIVRRRRTSDAVYADSAVLG